MINIGTDIIEISRFKNKPLEHNRTFYNSIFTVDEIAYCQKFKDPYSHFAGIFAAKEATIKCMGKPFSMSKIQLYWDKDGRPHVEIAQEKIQINVTISHTQTIAIAVAVGKLKSS